MLKRYRKWQLFIHQSAWYHDSKFSILRFNLVILINCKTNVAETPLVLKSSFFFQIKNMSFALQWYKSQSHVNTIRTYNSNLVHYYFTENCMILSVNWLSPFIDVYKINLEKINWKLYTQDRALGCQEYRILSAYIRGLTVCIPQQSIQYYVHTTNDAMVRAIGISKGFYCVRRGLLWENQSLQLRNYTGSLVAGPVTYCMVSRNVVVSHQRP